jgi:hypothetical protein
MSIDQTARLKLGVLADSQEMTPPELNGALQLLDTLVDCYLLAQYVDTPPGSPSDGDAYLIGGAPTGGWTGYPYKIAYCVDGGWRFAEPFNGLRAFVAATGAFIVYQDGAWADWNGLISAHEVSVASAAMCDLGAAGSLFVCVTGTAAISSFGTAGNRLRFVRFADSLTVSHDAASLILPGAADMVTAPGDTAIFASDSSGNWRCAAYQRAHGGAALATNVTGSGSDVLSAAPVLTGQVCVRRDAGYNVSNAGALYVQNATTPGKAVSIGYDASANFGYIQSRYEGTAAQVLALNPDGGLVTIQSSSLTVGQPASAGRITAASDHQTLDNFAAVDTHSGGGGVFYFGAGTGYPGGFGFYNATQGVFPGGWDSDSNFLLGYVSSNGAYKLQVNGQIFATSSTIATSHGPYKENQAELTGALDLVCALAPKTFTWKAGAGEVKGSDGKVLREAHNFPTGTQVGFIAQDVKAALAGSPFLGAIVKTNVRAAPKDRDGNIVGEDEEFLGIAEGNLIALLVGAVKELAARVAALEAA